MTKSATVGLLPLYLKLYDDVQKNLRDQFEPFVEKIVSGLSDRGIEVERAPICRLEPEFRAAVDSFEKQDVDMIVTVHLAYSPSLESVGVLASTRIPVLMLDTTMDAEFGLDVDPERIMYNHGIHGVQDLANVLRRRGKRFRIVAGHIDDEEVLDRVADIVRAYAAARALRGMRVLRIGESFRGMGDFGVPDALLYSAFGITVDTVDSTALAEWVTNVSPNDIAREMSLDRADYTVEAPEDVHRRSVRVGLGLRALLESKDYGAFSANFLAFSSPDEPVDTVPFLEASKAMTRGLGYAGEGDVLTAALVGALNGVYGAVNFTEMFCPDWQGGSVFLSHMGEFNPVTAREMPRLIEKPFPWAGAKNPAILTATPTPGPAVLVNLAPGPDDSFALVLAPVEVLGEATHTAMRDSVRGWMRPECSLESFLERYSANGGTHHSALVHSAGLEALEAFAEFAGLPYTVIN
ncbi:MAG: hypothetical protein HZB26_19595 [Candidatus Hydrogenedentes bacterium]|nr:hypothetical protein [Candidatus Hydrogenedentota bacterium]